MVKNFVTSLSCLFLVSPLCLGNSNPSSAESKQQTQISADDLQSLSSSAEYTHKTKKVKVSKEEKKRIKEFRAAHNMDTLDKLLTCAATLIERQFGKDASPRAGLSILSEVQQMAAAGNENYKPLKDRCKEQLKAFEKDKKRHPIEYFTREERDAYLASVAQLYTAESPLVMYARQALNPEAVCSTVFSFQFNAGLLVSVGSGMSRYLCTTPLGRKFHMTGPSFGIGLGVGLNVEVGSSVGKDEYRFSAPLAVLDGSVKLYSSLSHSVAFIGGWGEEWDPDAFNYNQDRIKFRKGDIGFGEHGLLKGDFVIRTSSKSDFRDLYKDLGIASY